MLMIERIHTHLKKGTLFRAVKKTVIRTLLCQDGDRYYNDTANNYLSRREKSEAWKSEQESVKKVLGNIPDRSSVLDVPFGTGRFVPLYLNKRMEVYGVDISRDMLRNAETILGSEFCKCDVRVGSAEELPFENETFDVVVCFRFLSYIVPFGVARQVLSEVHRVSKLYAIIQLPVRHDSARDLGPPKDNKKMLSRLKLKDIKQLLDKSGFAVIDVLPTEKDVYYDTATLWLRRQV